MTWQPIETAPKDGTLILGYKNGEMATVEWAYCGESGDWNLVVSWDGQPWTPTHWMPLPEPPDTIRKENR